MFWASLSILCLNDLLVFIILDKANVKSSSDLTLLSALTDGLTDGGGTGKVVIIIHSGLLNLFENPKISQSSYEILLNI